jgi:hypothetical protein
MKPTHDIRDKATGRYIPSRLCDACNKPAGTDPLCDDEVTGGHERPGFILCERKRCSAKLEKLGPEERRAIYETTVAERQGFNPNGRPRRPKGEPTELNIFKQNFYANGSALPTTPFLSPLNLRPTASQKARTSASPRF